MPNDAQTPPPSPGSDFREAFAQWRLKVHTEVKRASSLPTAMFDATDPMLEMRLAEATESLLIQLQRPSPQITAKAGPMGQRLERIESIEMAALPTRIGNDNPMQVDLLADLGSEYIAVLADACCTQDGSAHQRAARHMCIDFSITMETLDDVMQELQAMTIEIAQYGNQTRPHDEIERLVQRVGEVLHSHLSNSEQDGEPS